MKQSKIYLIVFLSIFQIITGHAGHYEGINFEDQKDIGEFYVVPDYFPSKHVLISQRLEMGTSTYGDQYNELQDMSLVAEILTSNIKVAMIGTSEDKNYYETTVKSQESVWEKYKNKDLNFENLFTLPYRVIDDWTRDWASPFLKKELNGPNVALLDSNTSGMRPAADDFPRWLAEFYTLEFKEPLKRISLPFYFQFGNLICNDSHCFISKALLRKNTKDFFLYQNGTDNVLFDTSSTGLSATEVEKQNKSIIEKHLQRYIKQKIVILDETPYELTGHLDLVFQFINNSTILLPKVSEETLRKSRTTLTRKRMEEIQKYFTSIESRLRANIPNLKVIYIPQPLGLIEENSEISVENLKDFDSFRSYANFLVINTENEKKIIFPSYINKNTERNTCEDKWYKDGCLVKKYEDEIAELSELKELGYQVKFIDANNLVPKGGALHCVTRQIPK